MIVAVLILAVLIAGGIYFAVRVLGGRRALMNEPGEDRMSSKGRTTRRVDDDPETGERRFERDP
jgi:hypothetical protein